MKKAAAALAIAALYIAAQARAAEFTLSPASPLEAVPAGTVERMEIAPLPGVPVAVEKPRRQVSYDVIDPKVVDDRPRPVRVPIPTASPSRVSFCLSEVR